MTMPEKQWKLGDDLSTCDSLLDGLTFDDLILAVHCNCQVIDRKAVLKTVREMIDNRLEDTYFLVERNMYTIMAEARKGREA